jgi:hypothetical protein
MKSVKWLLNDKDQKFKVPSLSGSLENHDLKFNICAKWENTTISGIIFCFPFMIKQFHFLLNLAHVQ